VPDVALGKLVNQKKGGIKMSDDLIVHRESPLPSDARERLSLFRTIVTALCQKFYATPPLGSMALAKVLRDILAENANSKDDIAPALDAMSDWFKGCAAAARVVVAEVTQEESAFRRHENN
jgi:hypothetical protein